MNSNAVIQPARQLSRQALSHRYAAFRTSQLLAQSQHSFHLRTPPPSLPRKQLPSMRLANQTLRHESSEAARPLTEPSPHSNSRSTADEISARKAQEPSYKLAFTCKKCVERSTHRITKQAYHFGTTLITCPGCKARHLISDHLKIFSDKSTTIEDILKEKGQFLRKGVLGEEGDVEWVDEGRVHPRLLAKQQEQQGEEGR